MTIQMEEVKKIPYFNQNVLAQTDGRTMILQPFYDGTDWKMPIPIEGKIQLISGTPASSTYIAKAICDSKNDLYIPVIDFLYKHASWGNILYHITGLQNDFENLLVSVNKLDTYHTMKDKDHCISDFVRTEMEYIFIVCKSIYDTLQKIFSLLWNTKVRLLSGVEKINLPEKYRNVVIHNGKRRNTDEIMHAYNIPFELATYYYDQIDFYEKLKTIRDDIVHREKTFDYFFVFEDGFAVSKDTRLFNEYSIWREEDKHENDLYSIRPLISYLVSNTIKSCNEYCRCINSVIKFPDSLLDGYSVFLRTPHVSSFLEMQESLQKSSWW